MPTLSSSHPIHGRSPYARHRSLVHVVERFVERRRSGMLKSEYATDRTHVPRQEHVCAEASPSSWRGYFSPSPSARAGPLLSKTRVGGVGYLVSLEGRALESDDDVPRPRKNSAVVLPARRERGRRDPFRYRNPTYTQNDTDSAGTDRVHGTFLPSGRLPDATYADSTDPEVPMTVCTEQSPSPCPGRRGAGWERIP